LHRDLHVLAKGTEVIDTKSQRGESVRRLRLKTDYSLNTNNRRYWLDRLEYFHNTAMYFIKYNDNIMIISGLHTHTYCCRVKSAAVLGSGIW